MQVGLFSSVKNEGPFLLEWVAYHRSIGFGPIVIFSNDSTDGTTALLDALDAQGAIHHVLQNLTADQVPQYVAADNAFDHPAFVDADWLMWMDADEFLFCDNDAHDVQTLTARFDGQADGICINWLNFGDSGLQHWAPGLVTQTFTRRGEATHSRHAMFKTLFKTSEHVRGFGLHRPFLKASFQTSGRQLVNSAGTPMHENVYRSGAFKRHALGDAPMALVAHASAAICHYAVKTRDCFEAKRRRGQGTKAISADDRASRFRERYWNIYNQNVVEDLRMRSFEDSISLEIDRLLADPVTASAHSDCVARYGQMLVASDL